MILHNERPVTDRAYKTPVSIEVPIPDGFRHAESLLCISRLVIELLSSGMPEHELAKRLMRYHPAQEGV